MPVVGQKRLRSSKKKPIKKQEDSEEEPEEESQAVNQDEGSFNEDDDDSQVVKKRKTGSGKAKVVKPKAKKGKKMPTEFKKGKWNPEVKLIKIEKQKEEDSGDLQLDCCVRCNNKNIIRATITGNERLLKKGMEETHKIS